MITIAMTDESSEPTLEENPNVLSRRQVLGGVAGTAAVSGVGGFFLGSYTGNPLWDDGAGEGPYPRESTSGFSLTGTAAPQGFPGGIDIYFDENVIRWGGLYWADDISRSWVDLPRQSQYQFFNGGGYYARVELYGPTPESDLDEPWLYGRLYTGDTGVNNYTRGTFRKAIIYLELVTHTPTIEIILPDDHSDFHGAEFWLDGLATSPRLSVGIVRPP